LTTTGTDSKAFRTSYITAPELKQHSWRTDNYSSAQLQQEIKRRYRTLLQEITSIIEALHQAARTTSSADNDMVRSVQHSALTTESSM